MPQYSFECQECQDVFDIDISMSEYASMLKKKKVACPKCGANKVARVFTTPAVKRGTSGFQSQPPCCPGGSCGH